MKKLISSILCTALIATCFCGCSREESSAADDKKYNSPNEIFDTQKKENGSFYLLKEWVQKNDFGEVLERHIYDYDDRGLVTSHQLDMPVHEMFYNEEMLIYEYILLPCDGEIDQADSITYDQQGSPTHIELHDGTNKEYRYTYDADGNIETIRQYDADGVSVGGNELEYGEDGTIKLWGLGKTGDETPGITYETAGRSNMRITKMTYPKHAEGVMTKFFEYDSEGRLIEFWYTQGSEAQQSYRKWNYDQKGNLISVGSFGTTNTFEYEGDRLVSIDGETLQYSEGDDGTMAVTFGNSELTYEKVSLTEAEIALARYRWNQFFGISYGVEHDYLQGCYGVSYPIYEVNTGLLLPKKII